MMPQHAWTGAAFPRIARSRRHHETALALAAMNAFTRSTATGSTVQRCGRSSRSAYAAGRAGSRPSASLIVALNLAGSAVSMHTSGTRGSRRSSPTLIPSAVCGSTTILMPGMHAADRRDAIGVRADPGNETGGGDAIPVRRARELESTLALDAGPQAPQDGGIAADHVEHVPLEIGRLGDVHRRTRRRVRLVGTARPIASGAEELVEHVVLVGREDQPADRQAHLARDMSGEDVAEIAGGHGEIDRSAVRFRRGEIAAEIVDDLGGDARPVDRIDRADPVAGLECGIGGHRLDDVLAVVEHPVDRDVVDVGVRQRKHLRLLERAHPVLGRQHEDIDAALAPHRVFGGGARIAGRRAQDVERASHPSPARTRTGCRGAAARCP